MRPASSISPKIAALLTRWSMRPKVSTVAAAIASVLAGSPTSVATNKAPSPS